MKLTEDQEKFIAENFNEIQDLNLLTQKAFNDELPCYFDSERGTIRFVKEELDQWVEIQNRYSIDGLIYKVYEDRLSDDELNIGNGPKKNKKKSKVNEGKGAVA